MRPPAFTIYHQVTITNIDNNKKIATVMDISLNYSIFNDDTVHQVSQEYIPYINQSHLITTSKNHIYDNFPWLKNDDDIKVFFLKEMQYPKQGYLFQNNNDTLYFKPGRKRKSTNKIIQLPDLHAREESLIL